MLSDPRHVSALPVREAIKGNSIGVFVSGLSEVRVVNTDDVIAVLQKGDRNRRIRATEMNEHSSRSHAILQISTEVESRGNDGATIIRRAKLNLVDLAGSEKWDTQKKMVKAHQKELTNINKSLSALGNVISALGEKHRTHVPYRDSKLTRLLQDSLGGNTHTLVFATISPNLAAIDETISTLNFADRAKSVMVRVKVNEVVDDAVLLARAQREIIRLQMKVRQLQAGGSSEESSRLAAVEKRTALLEKENARLEDENKRLKRKLRKAKGEKDVDNAEDRRVYQSHSEQSLIDYDDDGEDHDDERTILDYGMLQRQLESEGRAVEIADSLNEEQTNFDQIQAERRALEQQMQNLQMKMQSDLQEEQALERLYGAADSDDLADETDENLEGDEDDDDFCPVCRRPVDDHTDAELDVCIEQEAAMEGDDGAGAGLGQAATYVLKPEYSHLFAAIQQQHKQQPSLSTTQAESSSGIGRPDSPDRVILPQVGNGNVSMQREQVLQQQEEMQRRGDDLLKMSEQYLSKPSPSQKKNRQRRTNRLASSGVLNGKPSTPEHRMRSKSTKGRKIKQSNAKQKKARNIGYRVDNQSVAVMDKGQAKLRNSMSDVGSKLKVYVYRYDHWYPCTVVGFDRRRALHCCQYDDGDKKWHDLRQKEFKVISSSVDDHSFGRGGGSPSSAASAPSAMGMGTTARAYLSSSQSERPN